MRPAIPLPFAHVQTMDLPRTWPRAPRQGDARCDGSIIRPPAIGQALERLKATDCGPLTAGFTLARVTLTPAPGTVLRHRARLGAFPLLRSAPSAWWLFVIVARGLPSHAHPGGSPRGQRRVDRNDCRGGSRPSASGETSLQRTKAPNRGRHETVLPCTPLRLQGAIPLQDTETPCLPALEQGGCVGSEHRGRTPPGRTCGTGRGLRIFLDGPMGASPLGGEGFPRPPWRASSGRLGICRHPVGAMVWDLLRGVRPGHRAFRGTRPRVVILGGLAHCVPGDGTGHLRDEAQERPRGGPPPHA